LFVTQIKPSPHHFCRATRAAAAEAVAYAALLSLCPITWNSVVVAVVVVDGAGPLRPHSVAANSDAAKRVNVTVRLSRVGMDTTEPRLARRRFFSYT